MNTKKLIYCFFAALILISCDKDEDPKPTHSINGTWNLKNVSGGLIGIDIDYDKGEVIWNFNGSGTLIVENNLFTIEPDNTHTGLKSGSYTYEIKTENDKEVLYINNTRHGSITIDNNLYVDYGVAVDGFLVEFQR